MSLPQHKDTRLRFQQQADNSKSYVLPFIQEKLTISKGMRIMEIGCGEGGVLLPFLEMGCQCVGVELAKHRVKLGREYLKDHVEKGEITFITSNIYDIDFLGEFKESFDLVILKDAIEHIPNQEKIMGYIKQLLKPNGHIFLGFPPWQMPYGGHQQICESRLSKALYIHLLPTPIYRWILQKAEKEKKVEELLEIKKIGLSIERFNRILKKHDYAIVNKQFYLLNPIYKFKFGWRPTVQNRIIASIPFFRNFVTSCVYYLIRK